MRPFYMRRGLLLGLVVAGLSALVAPARAQQYPARTVHLVVPQAPGGATDAIGRALAQKLSERWGQPVVIENRAGAGGVVGTDHVAKAAADGYTLLVTYEGSQAINQSLYKSLPFHSLNDFTPVGMVASTPFFLVAGPKLRVKTLQEFVEAARQKPGSISYGSAGNGSVNHLLGEMLKMAAKIEMVHVPYKGASAALGDVIGGHIEVAFASVPSAISNVQAGQVTALGVSSAKRVAVAPDVPSVAEQGYPSFDVNPWWGVLGPKGLSPAIVSKLNADLIEVLRAPDLVSLLAKLGASPTPSSPEAFATRLQADIDKWAEVVRASGARIN
jgi:tripartite-type tricarboxylate transporter receptor subunit TctC